jgi:DNA-binding MarR family transcriptional regulator
MAVLSRVARLARHLDRARRTAFAEHGLEPWEFDVLTALRRAGPPYELSPGTLMAQTLVTSGTMTARVDKLEARGLVSRRRDDDDRRGMRVQLTPNGQEAVDAALDGLLRHERTLLADLSPAQRSELAGLLRILLLPFDETSG